jgi:hypothetical protein
MAPIAYERLGEWLEGWAHRARLLSLDPEKRGRAEHVLALLGNLASSALRTAGQLKVDLVEARTNRDCPPLGEAIARRSEFVAQTAVVVRALAKRHSVWAEASELEVFRPGLAEASEEYEAVLHLIADHLDENADGARIMMLALLRDLGETADHFTAELRAAVRAAVRRL